MNHHTHHHIAQAVEAMSAPSAHHPQKLSADELVIAISDLATLADLLGQFAARTRWQLAAWATVTAHLHQAEQHAGDLRRSLNHACATFAFLSPPTAA